jgi:hypothetical protein
MRAAACLIAAHCSWSVGSCAYFVCIAKLSGRIARACNNTCNHMLAPVLVHQSGMFIPLHDKCCCWPLLLPPLHAQTLPGQLPNSWFGLSRTMDGSASFNLQGNDLEGVVPLSWSAFTGVLGYLYLDSNPRLSGCVPLSPFTTLTYAGTSITGLCPSDSRDVEAAQRAALSALPALLGAGPEWPVPAQLLIAGGSTLREWMTTGQLTTSVYADDARGWVEVVLAVVEGTVYVTRIHAYGAGLDLTRLPALMRSLPRLAEFVCDSCNANSDNRTASMLPAELARAAPRSLVRLEIVNSALSGGVPSEWGNWTTLQRLNLYNNGLRGPLPLTFGGLAALGSLDLGNNALVGALPPEWGNGPLAQSVKELFLINNGGINGTVPLEWSTFQGGVFLTGTGVRGCVADQLVFTVFKNDDNTPCSSNSTEVLALLAIRRMVDPEGNVLGEWRRNNVGGVVSPGD